MRILHFLGVFFKRGDSGELSCVAMSMSREVRMSMVMANLATHRAERLERTLLMNRAGEQLLSE